MLFYANMSSHQALIGEAWYLKFVQKSAFFKMCFPRTHGKALNDRL